MLEPLTKLMTSAIYAGSSAFLLFVMYLKEVILFYTIKKTTKTR